jgi:lipase chaperone LimK
MSCTIPREALESFAGAIYPDIIAFFESEEGQREYEEWLKIEEDQKVTNETK